MARAQGRAKGQIKLKRASAADKSTSSLSSYTKQTTGIKGAKPGTNHFPRLHGRSSVTQEVGNAKGTRTNLRRQGPDTLNTVGLRGAKKGGTFPKTSTNFRRPGPDAVNTQGVRSASKRAPKQSLQSSGTGKTATGGKGIPFTGNRRVVSSRAPGASTIPAVVRRAASRPAPGAGSRAGKPSFSIKKFAQQVRGRG